MGGCISVVTLLLFLRVLNNCYEKLKIVKSSCEFQFVVTNSYEFFVQYYLQQFFFVLM